MRAASSVMGRLAALAVGLGAVAAAGPSEARADELLVFAAASTTDALAAIGREFTAATGHEVRFSFGSSATLARQILAGARADAFLSADPARMDELERAGLVRREARRDLLSNRLVVVVPTSDRAGRGAARAIDGPAALASCARVALADPASVPAGVYARAWLERAGVWADVAPHVIPTLDVRAALAAVAAGQVDAGVVYATDAATTSRVRVSYAVPLDAAPAIRYPLAPLARSRHAVAAEALVRFIAGPSGRAVFERLGFVVL